MDFDGGISKDRWGSATEGNIMEGFGRMGKESQPGALKGQRGTVMSIW